MAGFEPGSICLLPALWPWGNYLTSLFQFSRLPNKDDNMVPPFPPSQGSILFFVPQEQTWRHGFKSKKLIGGEGRWKVQEDRKENGRYTSHRCGGLELNPAGEPWETCTERVKELGCSPTHSRLSFTGGLSCVWVHIVQAHTRMCTGKGGGVHSLTLMACPACCKGGSGGKRSPAGKAVPGRAVVVRRCPLRKEGWRGMCRVAEHYEN